MPESNSKTICGLTIGAAILAFGAAILASAGCDSTQATTQNKSRLPPAPSPDDAITASASFAEEKTSPREALGTSRSAGNAETKLAVPERTIDKSFDDIKFEIEPGAPFSRKMLTDEIESLSGKKIRIRGYILPTAQSRGIKQFVLVRDNQECCFGPGAALYDCILVEMQPGKTAEFSVRPVAVEGIFQIELLNGPDEKPLAIYRMDADSVER